MKVETNIGCECVTYGRSNDTAILFLAHHPNCKQYRPEREIRTLLLRLIEGIEAWANDEDGVHPDCWEAYVAALNAVGQPYRAAQDKETDA
jgi:hypothetical protein